MNINVNIRNHSVFAKQRHAQHNPNPDWEGGINHAKYS